MASLDQVIFLKHSLVLFVLFVLFVLRSDKQTMLLFEDFHMHEGVSHLARELWDDAILEHGQGRGAAAAGLSAP